MDFRSTKPKLWIISSHFFPCHIFAYTLILFFFKKNRYHANKFLNLPSIFLFSYQNFQFEVAHLRIPSQTQNPSLKISFFLCLFFVKPQFLLQEPIILWKEQVPISEKTSFQDVCCFGIWFGEFWICSGGSWSVDSYYHCSWKWSLSCCLSSRNSCK